MYDWENALDFFSQAAKENGIHFYLIGSITASIRGVSITPHDIDVIVDIHNFHKAEAVFHDFVIEEFAECGSGPVKYFGKIRINHTIIEISAKPDNIYGRYPIETICWNGHMIQTQTLELLYKVYQKNNRIDYVKEIDAYWENSAGMWENV